MKPGAFEAVAMALDFAGVRYPVGRRSPRQRARLRPPDRGYRLVIALDADTIRQTFAAVDEIAHPCPSAWTPSDDPGNVNVGGAKKGIQVLISRSDGFPWTSVNVFAYEPFDFTHEYDVSMRGELCLGV